MIDDLAITIARMASRVPGGMLIFFPSYKLLNEIYDRW
jgi:Rad3-related DNA helicase